MTKSNINLKDGTLTLIYGLRGQYCSLLGLKLSIGRVKSGKVFLIDMGEYTSRIPIESFLSDLKMLERIFITRWSLREANYSIVELQTMLKYGFNMLGLFGLTESYSKEISMKAGDRNEVLRLNKIVNWIMGFLKFYSKTLNIPVFVTCEVEKVGNETRPAANVLRFWPDNKIWVKSYRRGYLYIYLEDDDIESKVKI
ncbi:MAG: hypothetical protein DRN81_00845 [Thermoproteota archaeon]|nr:MAG: hypothetical protein DRN81_00845 [Candidatus Korarchaeota archaeon]